MVLINLQNRHFIQMERMFESLQARVFDYWTPGEHGIGKVYYMIDHYCFQYKEYYWIQLRRYLFWYILHPEQYNEYRLWRTGGPRWLDSMKLKRFSTNVINMGKLLEYHYKVSDTPFNLQKEVNILIAKKITNKLKEIENSTLRQAEDFINDDDGYEGIIHEYKPVKLKKV